MNTKKHISIIYMQMYKKTNNIKNRNSKKYEKETFFLLLLKKIKGDISKAYHSPFKKSKE